MNNNDINEARGNYLWSIHYMPGLVLRDYCINSSNPHNIEIKKKNWGTVRLSPLSKVIIEGAKIWNQVVWLQSFCVWLLSYTAKFCFVDNFIH